MPNDSIAVPITQNKPMPAKIEPAMAAWMRVAMRSPVLFLLINLTNDSRGSGGRIELILWKNRLQGKLLHKKTQPLL